MCGEADMVAELTWPAADLLFCSPVEHAATPMDRATTPTISRPGSRSPIFLLFPLPCAPLDSPGLSAFLRDMQPPPCSCSRLSPRGRVEEILRMLCISREALCSWLPSRRVRRAAGRDDPADRRRDRLQRPRVLAFTRDAIATCCGVRRTVSLTSGRSRASGSIPPCSWPIGRCPRCSDTGPARPHAPRAPLPRQLSAHRSNEPSGGM